MLRFLIEKEFKQIFRNVFLPKLIFAMPLMMILVFPWAAVQDAKNINICIVDLDNSSFSQKLIQKVPSSGYFKLISVSQNNETARHALEKGDADIILEIQLGFEKELMKEGATKVMVSANAVNGMIGGLGASYLVAIIQDYAAELRDEYTGTIQLTQIAQSPQTSSKRAAGTFKIEPNYKFNPLLNYKIFMVPALMVMLITMLAGFLPALNIVSEKEAGTIEQMNVTPVSKIMFILAKLIPYWIIGFVVLNICMLLAWLVYDLTPAGSILTIYLFASIYVLVISGMGLVISNYSNTMQQAMFVMYFFIMILLLMSGLFTPVTSMPEWAQAATIVNPLKYFIQVMRLIYLKGSAFKELIPQFTALCAFAAIFNFWAVLSYRKSN